MNRRSFLGVLFGAVASVRVLGAQTWLGVPEAAVGPYGSGKVSLAEMFEWIRDSHPLEVSKVCMSQGQLSDILAWGSVDQDVPKTIEFTGEDGDVYAAKVFEAVEAV